MIDTHLISAIKSGKYDAWADPVVPSVPNFKCDTDGLLAKFEAPDLTYARADPWKRYVAWDLGKIRDPSAVITLKYRIIHTAHGLYTRDDVQINRESYHTPVYQITGAQEFREDYSETVARLKRNLDNGRLNDATLIFDATGVGVAVAEMLRHVNGFKQIIPLTISGGDKIKSKSGWVVAGKSLLLSDLHQVVLQQRLRTPENNKDFDKLKKQLTSLRVEDTISGYYKTVDDRSSGHHSDLLMSLAMAISHGEYLASKFRRSMAF